jgi:hypothetical protein
VCMDRIPATKRSHAKYCSDACGNLARGRAYYGRHPDKVMAKRLVENGDVARRIFYRAKSRAKTHGIAFAIDVSDIVVPTHCPVLGIELAIMPGQGSGYHRNAASLDKIKPALGYVKGNVRVISARANLLKNDATVDELRRVLADLEVLEVAHG